MAGGDKTEKATPKRRAEARKKGQVAKSQDLGGAVVLLAALFSLSALGPMAWGHMRDAMLRCLPVDGDQPCRFQLAEVPLHVASVQACLARHRLDARASLGAVVLGVVGE